MSDQYCPNVCYHVVRRLLKVRRLSPMHRGIDLKSKPVQPMHARLLRMRGANEFWEIDLCTADGLSSFQGFSTLCQTLPGRLQTQDFFLLGSVSLHDLRTVNVSRESARYRSLSARATHQALPSGHSRPSLAQYSGPCELGPRLAHLRRLRASADYPRSRAPTRTTASASSWRRRFTRSMPLPSICAWRFSPGPSFANTKAQ